VNLVERIAGVRKLLDGLEERANAYQAVLVQMSRGQALEPNDPSIAVHESEVVPIEQLVDELTREITGASAAPANMWEHSHHFCTRHERKIKETPENQSLLWALRKTEYFRWFLTWINRTRTYLEYLQARADVQDKPAGLQPTGSTEPTDDLELYALKEQPWYSPIPLDEPKSEAETQDYPVDAVILTAVPRERNAVLRLLKPLPGEERVWRVIKNGLTYYLGCLGRHNVVLSMCRMGYAGPGGSILSTSKAIGGWHPKAVIMVGIAFGKTPKKQKMADVLVSTQVICYGIQAIRPDGTVEHRGDIAPAGPKLLDRFRNTHQWHFARPDGTECTVIEGPILSGEVLANNTVFKENLFKTFPTAVGGEMEAAGVYAASYDADTPWIIVKAICDWADSNKKDKHQDLAAAAAASLVHDVLSNPFALSDLRAPQPPTRTSSTTDGTPATQPAVPTVDLELADLKRRKSLGASVEVECELIELPEESAFPSYRGTTLGIGVNEDYYRDKAQYVQETAFIRDLGFVVKNNGTTVATDVHVEITVAKEDHLTILDTSSYPKKPTASILNSTKLDISRVPFRNSRWVKVEEYEDVWVITARLGNVQPKATVYTEHTFLIGARKDCTVSFEAQVRADNLAEPVTTHLQIKISTKHTSLSVDDVIRRGL
jgi:nucleoside phosphorylase